MNSSLSIHYSRSFSGFVWKIIADPFHGLVWIESRDESEMTVQFHVVDVTQSRDMELTFPFEVEWWHHLTAGFGSVVVFQKIEDHSNPGSASLMVVDKNQQTLLHEIKESIVDSISDGVIIFRTKEESTQQRIDLRKNPSENNRDSMEQSVPYVYPEGSPYHDTVRSFLHSLNINPVGPVCYLEKRDSILVSYHSKGSKGISRHFLWIQNEKEILHRTMDEQMKGYSHESFMVFGNYIILLFERKHLEIYSLN